MALPPLLTLLTLTDQELLVIALINRARLDPAAEATRLSIPLNEGLSAGTLSPASKQPLAFNHSLIEAARAHSQAMITQDFLAHTNPFTGSTPQTRSNAAGYSGEVSENVSARAVATGDITATTIQQHELLFFDRAVAGRVDRLNILHPDYQQIGVGIAAGVTDNLVGRTFYTQALTQDLGIPSAGGQFITGIAYTDTGDNFYSAGEGRSGVFVTTAAGTTMNTQTGGGYARSIGTGLQTISFYGGGLTSTISLNAAVTAGRNILIDVVGQSRIETSTSIDEVANIDTIVGLGTIGLSLRGAAGNDSIFGTKGDDTLSGGEGDDSIDGGNGGDTANFSGNRNAYTVTQDPNGSWIISGADGTDTLTNVEFATFSDQTMVLGAAINTFDGNSNNNFIEGDGGNNTVNGFAANDTLNGNDGNDVVNGGDNNDTISGGEGNDTLDGGLGLDSLNGGEGNDSLVGGSGSDSLDGGRGNDRMAGGAGNDFYFVDNNDVVVELAGEGSADIIRTTRNTYFAQLQVERVIFVGTGNFVGLGNAESNQFNGNAGDDRFVDQFGGSDTFSGGAGLDSMDFRTSTIGAIINLATGVHGGVAVGDVYSSIERFIGSDTQADIMTGGVGRANFLGLGGNDTLSGGNNIDALQGDSGDDVLNGLGGVDSLDGGAGNDTMTGGLGAKDYFIYAAAGFGQDIITDFEDNLDKLKVHSSVATSIAAFSITGNGSTNVVLTQISSPTNAITLQGASAITITATDFLFY